MSKRMLRLELSCPHCKAKLTQGNKVPLDAYVRETQQHGQLSLSAIFGDYTLDAELDLSEGSVVEFHCPQCEASLMLPLPCKLCGAPMASLSIEQGGYLEFCSRRGCKGHALGGIGDVDEMMNLMNRMFETPYD
jgi:endogenous inhibitor of DNA gyrase (YacG/DUF329 family)